MADLYLPNNRILIIDDAASVHRAFIKTLSGEPEADADLASQEVILFGQPDAGPRRICFQVDSAMQGQEGVEKVRQSVADGKPYALAFVDMRMPPGWDGIQTTEELWKVDPDLQVVICSAYSDYPWEHVIDRLGATDRLLILRKPFDNNEVLQLSIAMSYKWGRFYKLTEQLNRLQHQPT